MAAALVCGKRAFNDYIGSEPLPELPIYKKSRYYSSSNDAVLPTQPQEQNTVPVDGAGWVDLLVKEMMNATSIADAKSRAAKILENVEKFISSRVSNTEALENANKETSTLKEQLEAVNRDNQVLKRAVAIQHERQKEYEDKNRDLELLKSLAMTNQEELRKLRVSNYGLSMQLRNAEQGNSMTGNFNRDVY